MAVLPLVFYIKNYQTSYKDTFGIELYLHIKRFPVACLREILKKFKYEIPEAVCVYFKNWISIIFCKIMLNFAFFEMPQNEMPGTLGTPKSFWGILKLSIKMQIIKTDTKLLNSDILCKYCYKKI
jgi:hypothetical protein